MLKKNWLPEQPDILLLGKPVFYSVGFLGSLGVVESVEGPHQVAGYAADSLERLITEVVGAVDVIPVYVHVNGGDVPLRVLLQRHFGVVVYFLLRKCSAGHIDFHKITPL